MPTRAALILILLVPLLAAPVAWARGGGVTDHLLQKGLAELTRAEAAYHRSDKGAARLHGRRAQQFFNDAAAQDPNDSRPVLLGGQAATLAGDIASAERWLNRLHAMSRLGERDPDVTYLAAFVHLFGHERPDRALRMLRRMQSLNPLARPKQRDNLSYIAHRESGRLMMEAGKFSDAERQFHSAARIARTLGDRARELSMLGNVGICMRRDRRFVAAHDHFQKLIDAEPNDPVWRWHMALNLGTQSRFADAIPQYREVVTALEAGRVAESMRSELNKAYLRLGNCLRVISDQPQHAASSKELLAEAEKALRRYTELDPQSSLGHKWLGVYLLESAVPPRPYEALEHFHRAFELDEICEDALKYVILVHERYPPPEGTSRKDWKAPIAGWKKNVESGLERRKKARDARGDKTGDSGCS